MAEIITVVSNQVGASTQNYDERDLSLIQQFPIPVQFGEPGDYIEAYVYSLDNQLLFSNTNLTNYRFNPEDLDPENNTARALNIYPDQDIKNFGIDRGAVTITYYFYRNILASDPFTQFWIKEISSDRTELKVSTQQLSNDAILAAAVDYQVQAGNQAYYYDFLLNFGLNRTLIGVNLAPATDTDGDTVILVKLYEPLPSTYDIKDTFWFVEQLNIPQSFTVTVQPPAPSVVDTTPRLRGPNFSIAVNQQIGQTVGEYSYNDLFSAPISSSYQQLKSLLDEKGLEINVDYSDFRNFIHFSSVTDRIYNFTYKVQLIESYSADITSLDNVVGANSKVIGPTKEVIQDKINNIIEKFDGFEYYLYYETGSLVWPKRTSNKPYDLFSVTSSEAIAWLGSPTTPPAPTALSILYSASYYDAQNKNLFLNTIPTYLRDDETNLPYETFLNMVGQYFDNIWIYLKDVTEKYNANSSLSKGISKDLVANTLKGLGINLYTNSNISDNLFYSALGFNPNGNPLPPTGSEQITYYVTSSEATMAEEDVTLEYYKRLYHNLPYLLKTKGTERGIRALINCYGIPDTLLRINEYGGVPKESPYSGYIQRRFSLAYENDYTSSIAFPWAPSYYNYLTTTNASVVPDAIEFRFKTKGIPTASYYSQSVFQVGDSTNFQFGVNLVYTPTIDLPTSSYQDYGYMTMYLAGAGTPLSSSAIHLPFFDNETWWTVLIQRETGSILAQPTSNNVYWLYVKNSYYNEEGISRVGFEGSASIAVNGATQPTYNASWSNFNPAVVNSFVAYLGGSGDSNNILSPNDCNLDGYFQEFRYWATPISETSFDKHVLNSSDYSLENPTGSQFNLIFRAPLGNNLTVPYKNSSGVEVNKKDYDLYLLGYSTIDPTAIVDTIHPAVTGSYYIPEYGSVVTDIQTFLNGAPPYGYGIFSVDNPRSFVEQEFTDLVSAPTTGISQKVNNKIIVETYDTGSYPVRRLLSTDVTLQRYDTDRVISNTNLEIAYSPADVIDDDIINQLGGFNIDDYIGSPSDRYTVTYPDLEKLKDLYFSKYLRSFNLYDFIRLLKYIDNSLFKMIKDFVPAKADLATGVVIKPHLLERSKYQRFEPILTRSEYTGSIDTAFITGSTPEGKNYPTAYSMSVMTPSGSTYKLYPEYLAQYTGEFSGSQIDYTNTVFPQIEVSNVVPVNSSWLYLTTSLDPLLNNVTQSRKSTRFYDLDYSSNAIIPVNYNLITYSINEAQAGNALFNDPYIPWAQVQDSNYDSRTYTIPRYEGSKTISRLYSTYSVGDSSYGSTAAIDKIRNQYAYLVDIYTASLTLPSRSNAQIKYLIDDNENVLDLTKENKNIFDVQNLYKGGEVIDISLFDYTDQSTTVLTSKQITLYEGGYRYLPVLHNITGSQAPFSWSLSEPRAVTTTLPGQGGGTPVNCSAQGIPPKWSNPNNWAITYTTNDPFPAYGNNLNITGLLYTGGPITDLPPGCGLSINIQVLSNFVNNLMCYSGIPNGITIALENILISAPYTGFPFFPVASAGVTCLCPFGGPRLCDPITLADNITFSISATSPTPGTSVNFTNTTGTPVVTTLQRYCDTSPQTITLPPGLTTLCAHPNATIPTPPGVTVNPGGTCNDCGAIPPVTFTSYQTSLVDGQPCLRIPALMPDQPSSLNRTVKFSQVVSDAVAEGYDILFEQAQSDPAYNAYSESIEVIQFPFSLRNGDTIHFYSSSLGWSEKEEYRVVTTFFSGSDGANTANRRYYAVLDRSINQNVLTTLPDTANRVDGTLCKYIVAKHLPDETNLILRYNPISPSLVENGIVYPQYIQEAVRKNAGNVIKSLKSQGLI